MLSILTSFLFFPINGSGLGHLNRCLAYARHLQKRGDCTFFTLASAIEFIECMGFPADYFLSPFWSCNSTYHWNTELAVRFGMILEHIQPKVIIFDGTWPFQGFLSTCKAYRSQSHKLKIVWSKRGFLKKTVKVCPVDERLFDMILEPGELGCEYHETILSNGTTRKITIPPVTLMRDEEILTREEACRTLNLDPNKHYVLFSLGSGNLKDVNELGQRLIQGFQQEGFSPVWACPPISVQDIELPSSVRTLSVFPLVQYLRAFDVLVGAAGYNTCYEIVQAGIPSLLIPNTLLADDQTRRAELIAKHAPVIVNACETEEALAAAVHEVITLTKNLKAYPKAQLNGAELAAQALLNLAGRRSA